MRNKKADFVWQRLSHDWYFRYLITEIRKEFLIPKNGFKKTEEQIKWWKKLNANKKEKRKCLSSISEILDNDWGYKITKMEDVIFGYLYFNKVEKSTLFNVNNTECDIFIATPDNIEDFKDKIESGIYIKIGWLARPSDLALFLEQNKHFIEAFRKSYLKVNNIPENKTKYKMSKHPKRDSLVKALNVLSINELKKLNDGIPNPRDIQIKKILNKYGFKISEETVRKILSKKQ